MKHIITIFILLIFFAASTLPAQINWTKDANPILSGGAAGTWNRHVLSSIVLYNADSARYEMWYSASDDPVFDRPWRIGFATSLDGITWTKLDTAVLEPDAGTWDESSVEGQSVIRENGIYKMWYMSCSWSPSDIGGIGYATSTNGINWTKDTLNNPVMVPGSAAWEAGGYGGCIVLPVQGGYKIWYGNYNADWSQAKIGYATSTDGIAWTPYANNPVLTHGSVGSWDDGVVDMPQVLFIDSLYHMWYYGSQTNQIPPWQVGLATSVDGINWNKYNDTTTTSTLYSESDPVLQPSSGQWDRDVVFPGTVILEGGSLRMWYSGAGVPTSTHLFRIGHATASIDPNSINNSGYKNIPQGFVMSQNYPNPFNPNTTIEFSIPKTEYVMLKIYNLLGQEVASLVSEKLKAGSYNYSWNAGSLASGVYIYKIQAGAFQEVKKMILLR